MQFLLGPQLVDLCPHLRALHRDRRFGRRLGLGCGGALPPLHQQRQDGQQDEERRDQGPQHQRARVVEGVRVHPLPPGAQTTGQRGVVGLRQRLFPHDHLGVQCRGPAVPVGDRLVQGTVGVAQEIVGGARPGPAAGQSGDPGLRAVRGRVHLAARHHQRVIAALLGPHHLSVHTGPGPTCLLERFGGRLDRRRGLPHQLRVDGPAEHHHGGQLTEHQPDRDPHTQPGRQRRTAGGHRMCDHTGQRPGDDAAPENRRRRPRRRGGQRQRADHRRDGREQDFYHSIGTH